MMAENNEPKELDMKNNSLNSEKMSDSEEEILDGILEGIPKEDRHEVKKMIGMSMQMGRVISPEMELMKKMTPAHVTEFLDTQKKAMENQFKENREDKVFIVVVLIIIVVFIVVLIVLLKDKPDIMEKILYTLGGLITGVFGGYGFGRIQKEN